MKRSPDAGLLSPLILAGEVALALKWAMVEAGRRECLLGEKHSKQGRNHQRFHETLPLVDMLWLTTSHKPDARSVISSTGQSFRETRVTVRR